MDESDNSGCSAGQTLSEEQWNELRVACCALKAKLRSRWRHHHAYIEDAVAEALITVAEKVRTGEMPYPNTFDSLLTALFPSSNDVPQTRSAPQLEGISHGFNLRRFRGHTTFLPMRTYVHHRDRCSQCNLSTFTAPARGSRVSLSARKNYRGSCCDGWLQGVHTQGTALPCKNATQKAVGGLCAKTEPLRGGGEIPRASVTAPLSLGSDTTRIECTHRRSRLSIIASGSFVIAAALAARRADALDRERCFA